jgi:hypothetical protein
MPEGMAGDAFGNLGLAGGLPDRFLKAGFVVVMALHDP